MIAELFTDAVFHQRAVRRVPDRVVQQPADRGVLPAAVLED
jgi:hypothetical protein